VEENVPTYFLRGLDLLQQQQKNKTPQIIPELVTTNQKATSEEPILAQSIEYPYHTANPFGFI
jgi:hypothetical protein